jgi:putative acetyltransferase
MEYITVNTKEEYAAAATLFSQYAAAININLDFQHFEDELKTLQQMYAAPAGGIILCRTAEAYIACVAVRKTDADTAELKRMFVQPQYQGRGLGKILLQKSLALARQCGYKKIQLDTLNYMHPAIELYKAHGFYEIPAYYHNPIATAIYFEKIL